MLLLLKRLQKCANAQTSAQTRDGTASSSYHNLQLRPSRQALRKDQRVRLIDKNLHTSKVLGSKDKVQQTLHSRAGRSRTLDYDCKLPANRHCTRIVTRAAFTLVDSRLVHLANASLHILPNDRHFMASTSPASPITLDRSPHHAILIHIVFAPDSQSNHIDSYAASDT